MIIEIANGFYQSPSLPFSNQRCVNLFPEMAQAASTTPSMLLDVGGIEEVFSLGYDSGFRSRGGWVFNGSPYIVCGQKLYRIDRRVLADRTYQYEPQSVGIVDGSGPCRFASSKNQMLVVSDEGIGYVLTGSTGVFGPISDLGFYANGTPKHPTYINGYFVVVTANDKAIVSGVNDASDWNSLDVIVAEADSDATVAPVTLNNQLYLLGEFTGESYQNIVTSGVPFQRTEGYLLKVGCSAADSVVTAGPLAFWVGRGKNERAGVYVFDGGQPLRISTVAIDSKFNRLTLDELSAVRAWTYSTNGHMFVAFTTKYDTFVYDALTQKWHERVSVTRPSENKIIEVPCRIFSVMTAYNSLIVTDAYDGRVGEINESSRLEYGHSLPKWFTTAPLFNEARPFSLPMVELLCEAGVGNSFDPDPVVTMKVSRDGVTFEDPQTRELGRRGQHGTRPIWYKQGRVSKLCVLEFRTYAPVKCAWYGVSIRFKAGSQ